MRDTTDVARLAEGLDSATHEERVRWVRSLNARDQRRLYELSEGRPVHVEELVFDGVAAVRHLGKNALPLLSRFEKRITRVESGFVGYNVSEAPRPFRGIASWFTGPGLFTAYDSPEVAGEVWIDYRKLPSSPVPPGFPPLQSNEHGFPALVFGDMVDVLRRVSHHVVVGNAFKARFPRPDRPPLLARIGALLPTATFVMCQEPAP